jgi:hypothetical protein
VNKAIKEVIQPNLARLKNFQTCIGDGKNNETV